MGTKTSRRPNQRHGSASANEARTTKTITRWNRTSRMVRKRRVSQRMNLQSREDPKETAPVAGPEGLAEVELQRTAVVDEKLKKVTST